MCVCWGGGPKVSRIPYLNVVVDFTSIFSFRLSTPTLFGGSSDHTSVTLFIQQAGFLNSITHVGSNYHTEIQTEIAAACTSHMHREAEHNQLTFTSVFFHSKSQVPH